MAEDGDFIVTTTEVSSGDCDLYVRKGSKPTGSKYDCRSWDDGSNEECKLSGAGEYYIGIYGYTTVSYDLNIVFNKKN